MKKSQVLGMTNYKTTDTIRGHVTCFRVEAGPVCLECGRPTERIVSEVVVHEPGLSTKEIFVRLNGYGLKAKNSVNQRISGVNTPSETCCRKCSHTVESLI